MLPQEVEMAAVRKAEVRRIRWARWEREEVGWERKRWYLGREKRV